MPEGSLDYLKEELSGCERRDGSPPPDAPSDQRARSRSTVATSLNLASNNYRGLAPTLGLGSGGQRGRELWARSGAVRTIAGTMTCTWSWNAASPSSRGGAALMFPSGFAANSGTVAGYPPTRGRHRLGRAQSRLDHRRRPLSRAEIKVFPHRTPRPPTGSWRDEGAGRRQLLITDGVFSMDGDIAPLPDLVEVAERHGAVMMIDDAHASGVLGRRRRAPCPTSAWRAGWTSSGHGQAIGVLGGSSIAAPPSDRVARQPGPALPLSARPLRGCGGGLPGGARRDAGRAERLERLGSNTDLFKAACTRSGSIRGQRDAHHPGHRRRRKPRSSCPPGVGRRRFPPAIGFPTVARGGPRPDHRHPPTTPMRTSGGARRVRARGAAARPHRS